MIWPLNLLSKRWTPLENPNRPLDGQALELIGEGIPSKSGQTVTAKRALTISAVWQAVSMISGDVAKMPLELFRKEEESGQEKRYLDKSHPAFLAVARRANDAQHAFKVWRRLMVHVLIWNQGFLWVQKGPRGQVQLFNLLPDRTYLDPTATDTSPAGLYFTQVGDGEPMALYPSEVIHIEGISFGTESTHELELVRQARDAWGIALATQDFKSRFYKNNGHAGGYLEIPAHFTEKAAANLEEGFRKRQSGGSDNWFKAVVLRDGAKFHQSTIDPERQQLSQATEDQVMDVARWYNLQPSRLGVRSAVSYGSKSEDNQGYFDQTLSHWCQSIASECWLKLLTSQQQQADSHEFVHNNRALVANDAKTRAEVGQIEMGMGAITVNEYRASTGRNPLEGGDVRIIPMNHYIISPDGSVVEPEVDDVDTEEEMTEPVEGMDEPEEVIEEQARQMLLEACAEQLKNSTKRVKVEISRRKPLGFVGWWDRCRANLLADFSAAMLAPCAVYRSATGQDVEKQVAAVVESLARSVDATLETAKADELAGAIRLACEQIDPNPFGR